LTMTTMIGQPRLCSSCPEHTLALYASRMSRLGTSQVIRVRLHDGPELRNCRCPFAVATRKVEFQNSTHWITKWELDGGGLPAREMDIVIEQRLFHKRSNGGE
jgi:hypothetical protein